MGDLEDENAGSVGRPSEGRETQAGQQMSPGRQANQLRLEMEALGSYQGYYRRGITRLHCRTVPCEDNEAKQAGRAERRSWKLIKGG